MEEEKADWIARDVAQQCLRADAEFPGWPVLALERVTAEPTPTPQAQVYRATYLWEISRRVEDQLCTIHGHFAPVMEAGVLVFPGSDPYAEPELEEDLADLAGHAHWLRLRCGEISLVPCR